MALSAAQMAEMSRLLDEALPLDTAARERWLAELPAQHSDLATSLRAALLPAGDEARETGQFERLPKIAMAPDAATTSAGEIVGPYRLIRQIGTGGMGAVWLAERVDGALKRQVALKLPRLAWAQGLAERMRRERDILATLEHPHIARLYDAGVDDKGRPYLALEYVEGEHIDAYLKTHNPPVRERLQLFLQVAQAVAHAHAHLVVHRDLKPSNILVDAGAQVRLLDFGIAKLLEGDAAGATQLTELAGAALTPDFASPEQIRGDPITMASDVYSLGVVLYEMLTGSRPFKFERSTAGAVAEALAAREAPAASHHASDKLLQKALRGDIDTILAKALKKDPALRYATVESFAADVQRYLDGQPVLARPDSAAYRLRKFVARNQLGVAGSLITLLAILGGAGAAVWQAHRAQAQALRAEAEAQRAKQVQDFVAGLFRATGGDDTSNVDLGQTPAQVLLERGVKQIDTAFAGRPDMQAQLTGVIATALADVGSSDRAVEQAQRQLKLLESTAAPATERVAALQLLARAQTQQSRLPEAEATLRKALDTAQALGPSRATDVRLELVQCLIRKPDVKEAQKELEAAESAWKEAGATDTAQESLIDLSRAELLRAFNHPWAEAKPPFERAVQLAEQSRGPDSPLAVQTNRVYARILAIQHEPQAVAYYDKVLTAMRRRNGELDLDAALMEAEAVNVLVYLLPRDEALRRVSNVRRVLARIGDRVAPLSIARANLRIGEVLAIRGKVTAARPLVESAAAALPGQPENFNEVVTRLDAFGTVLADAGEHQRADALFREEYAYMQKAMPERAFLEEFTQIVLNLLMAGDLAGATAQMRLAPKIDPHGLLRAHELETLERTLASIDIASGQPRKAAERLMPFVKAGTNIAGNDVSGVQPGTARTAGWALCESGDIQLGARLLERYVIEMEKIEVSSGPYLALGRSYLGLCLLKTGDVRRARELAALAQQAFTEQPGVSPYFKKPFAELQRRLKAAAPPGAPL
jgi:serine/threonine-protein kinase